VLCNTRHSGTGAKMRSIVTDEAWPVCVCHVRMPSEKSEIYVHLGAEKGNQFFCVRLFNASQKLVNFFTCMKESTDLSYNSVI